MFAYVGPEPFDGDSLRDVANLAATRGPHSHGFVWQQADGDLGVHRGLGDLRNGISDLLALDTEAVVGHSRLATTGTYAGGAPSLEDTMPFVAGDFAIVHNGNVRNYLAIAKANNYKLVTGCDSEVIVHLLSHCARVAPDLPLSAHLSMVWDRIDDGRPFVVIAMNSSGEVAAIRRGLPLYTISRPEGIYLCSRDPEWMDSLSERVPENLTWGYPTFTRRAA